MSATEITVIGNVVDSPRRVRLQNSSVTNFRLAATERRFDRERQEFVDGGTFWADVECWNDLGGNVSHTLSKGDPVIVVGTLSTRQWETENGRGSVSQIRAEAVGPNLSRGVADFKRLPRTAAIGADGVPAQPGPPADENDADHSTLRPGVDYVPEVGTPEEMDADEFPEPAAR